MMCPEQKSNAKDPDQMGSAQAKWDGFRWEMATPDGKRLDQMEKDSRKMVSSRDDMSSPDVKGRKPQGKGGPNQSGLKSSRFAIHFPLISKFFRQLLTKLFCILRQLIYTSKQTACSCVQEIT